MIQSEDNTGQNDENTHFCPECGAVQNISPVTLVTPGSEELADLFQAKLNASVCHACGEQFYLSTPVLFRDDEGKVMVYYIPEEIRSPLGETETGLQAVLDDVFANNPDTPRPVCRLVLSYRGFMEKTAVFLQQLDDVVIEYIKYQLYQDSKRDLDPVRTEILYDYSGEDEENLEFVVFDRETGEAQGGISVPLDVYEEVQASIAKDADLKSEIDRLFPGYYLNVDRIFEEGLQAE